MPVSSLNMRSGLARRGEKQFPLLPGRFFIKGVLKRAELWLRPPCVNAAAGIPRRLQKELVQEGDRSKDSPFDLLMGTIQGCYRRKNSPGELRLETLMLCDGQGSDITMLSSTTVTCTVLLPKKNLVVS